MKTAIVWFKTDLRLDDNEAPLKANRQFTATTRFTSAQPLWLIKRKF
jgi:deoxyribodipyrimidine photolyase